MCATLKTNAKTMIWCYTGDDRVIDNGGIIAVRPGLIVLAERLRTLVILKVSVKATFF
jgi:hypothetical protein